MLPNFPIAVFLMTVMTGAASVGATVAAQVVETDMDGVENFSIVSDTTSFGGVKVGFGGATNPSAMSGLRSEGFIAVVNLRLTTEEGATVDAGRAAAQAAGLKYIHLPFDDENPDKRVVDDFLATVRDKVNQPVYIHCNSATRVAALWMIGRVLEDGWEMNDAIKEGKKIAEKPDEAAIFATKYVESYGKSGGLSKLTE